MQWWLSILLVCVGIQTIPLVVIDIREHRLPNVWVLPGYLVVIVSWCGQWVTTGEPPLVSMFSAAGYFVFLWALSFFGGMGFGDVKLALVLGAAAGALGTLPAVLSPMLAFTLGALASVVMMIVASVTTTPAGIALLKKQRIAFGPFMLAGFWLALLVGVVIPTQ